MTDADPQDRWRYRLTTYSQALETVRQACALTRERKLSALEQAGLIQQFALAWDVGWKLLADLLEADGVELTPRAPKTVIRTAMESGLILDGQSWIDMTKARNWTSHIYDQQMADEVASQIIANWMPVLESLETHVRART
jgi:nucleotidyltransferase substrate binding protein (TIGR01987 family)